MRCDTTSPHAGAAQRSLLQSLGCAVKTSGARLVEQFKIDDKKSFSCGECTVLVLLTLVAAGLRLYKLGEWSYYIDEFHTAAGIERFFSTSHPWFHPNSRALFYLVTKASLMTLGESAFAWRFSPFLFGVFTIPLAYFPIRRLFDKYVAFIAVAILAVSPWHIYMSQMARWYTLSLLVAFFAITSFYKFLDSGSKLHFITYLLLTYVATTLHETGFFVPMIVVAYLVLMLALSHYFPVVNKRRLIWVLAFHIIGCLAFVPKFLAFISEWTELEEVVGSWGRDFPLKAAYHLTPSLVLGSLTGMLLLVSRKDPRGLLLAVYGGVPFILLSVSAQLDINVSARYQFFTLPAFAIGAGFTVAHIYKLVPTNKRLISTAIVLLMLVPSLQTTYLYFTSEHGYRHRSKEAMQYIKTRMVDGDQLFIAGIYPDNEGRRYAERLVRSEGLGIVSGEMLTAFPENLDRSRRAWVLTLSRAVENPEGFQKWIAENAHLWAEFPTRRAVQDQTLKVYLYSP
jgi:mannosyltransferase